jgi:uncharacterized lipoprotein YajG
LIERQLRKPPKRSHLVEHPALTRVQRPVVEVEAEAKRGAIDSMEAERVGVALETVEKDGEGEQVVGLVINAEETKPLFSRKSQQHKFQQLQQRQFQSKSLLQLTYPLQ